MLKKLLSILLVICILPALPAAAQTTEYDASVFGNNAGYIIQEHFAEPTSVMAGTSERFISGWDTDYRGGHIRMSGGALRLDDISDSEKISMSRNMLPVKEGRMVFETALTIEKAMDSYFTVRLGDENGFALMLEFYDNYIYQVDKTGKKEVLTKFEYDKKINIKAYVSVDEKKISLLIDNILYEEKDFSAGCDAVDNVYLSTGEKAICAVRVHYVNAYVNYIVNERFISADEGCVPYGFEVARGDDTSGIDYAPGSPYADDRNGFALRGGSVANPYLTTTFENSNTCTELTWTMLMQEKQDGVFADIMQGDNTLVSVKTHNGSFYVNNTLIKENYLANMWYVFTVKTDNASKTFDVELNYKTVAENVSYSGGIPNKLSISKNSAYGELMLDDIGVSAAFEKYDDYPDEPVIAESHEANTGMIMYSMWREGMHFGWDTIAPYADKRKPLMGYYTEGQIEVADWQTKWLSEHGVDYAIYSFVRPNSLSGEPIKRSVRGEDLNDGYMNSLYKPHIKFAILLSAFGINASSSSPDEKKYHGADEFIENVIPYLSEYYFSDPQYMKINNRLPLYAYGINSMISTLGGASEVKKVLDALDAEAVSLGYDGIIFCADAASSGAHSGTESIAFENTCVWSYGSTSGNADAIKIKINDEYKYSPNAIASIPMGYNDTPWRECDSSDMMNPEQVASVCEYVVNHDAYKASPHKMVTFTCWNEYGEGHYFAPSTIGGFGYVNAIRSAFTSEGEKTDEQVPTDGSVARMEALYPPGRGALSIRADQRYTEDDMKNRTLLYRKDFNSAEESAWSRLGNCTAEFKDGAIECVATDKIPGIYFALDDAPDISEVKALRLRGYSKGAKFFRVYYTTENNTTEGQGKYFDSTRITRPDGYTDYILYPATISEDSGYPTPTGRITGVRISTEDDLYLNGAKFGLDYLEFYSDTADREILYRYEYDDKNVKTINKSSCTAAFKGGALECVATENDCQLYMYDDTGIDISDVEAVKIRAYAKGSNEFKLYYITENDRTYGGGKNFIATNISDDGEYADYILTHPPLSPAPTGKIVGFRIDPHDKIYLNGAEFGIDRVEFLGNKLNCSLVLDGQKVEFMSLPTKKDGIWYIPAYSVALNEMKAFPVWDESTKTLTVKRKKQTLSVTAGSSEVVVNGRKTVWSAAPYLEKGNLYVPCEEYAAALGYDVNLAETSDTYICSTRAEFALEARGEDYGDNLAIGFKSSSGSDYLMMNMSSTLNFEDVNGEEALKIVPDKTGTDALFSARYVNYKGVRTKLDDIVTKGTKMKVSFSFMGVCNGIAVENRTGNHIDKKISRTNINPNNWTTFTCVFDNSTVENNGEARWLTLRVISSDGQEPYLYIKDYNIQIYEETELTGYSSDFDVYVTAPVNQLSGTKYNCFAAEYSSDGRLVSVKAIADGDTAEDGEVSKKYTYSPGGGSSVKLFLWSDTAPLCEIKELQKR